MDSSTKVSTDLWAPGPALHLTADDVRITSDVTVEIRSKGIYTVPVYVAKIAVTGQFRPDAMARLLISDLDVRALPSHATLQLPLSSIKYVRSLQRFDVGGQALHATSGQVAGLEALSVPIDLAVVDRTLPLSFQLEFDAAGSESLKFLPLGGTTAVSARVGWPHPDFEGAFFPAFGVRLLQPSDLYTQNYRAVRYGILFVAITFACFFAWEHLVIGAALAASYGLLYVILRSQDYALLFGSLLLFAILANLMLATRRLDWVNIRREESAR